jgi:hypothetical protein
MPKEQDDARKRVQQVREYLDEKENSGLLFVRFNPNGEAHYFARSVRTETIDVLAKTFTDIVLPGLCILAETERLDVAYRVRLWLEPSPDGRMGRFLPVKIQDVTPDAQLLVTLSFRLWQQPGPPPTPREGT